MIVNGLTIQGSVVASRYIHKRMLAFAALHGIAPILEKFPMTEKGKRTISNIIERKC